jgi:hypothetical protein
MLPSLEERLEEILAQERERGEVVEHLGEEEEDDAAGGAAARARGRVRARREAHEIPWKTLLRIARSDPQVDAVQLGKDVPSVLEKMVRVFVRELTVRAHWAMEQRIVDESEEPETKHVLRVEDIAEAVRTCYDGRLDFLHDILCDASAPGAVEDPSEDLGEETETGRRRGRHREPAVMAPSTRRSRRKRSRDADEPDDHDEEEVEPL